MLNKTTLKEQTRLFLTAVMFLTRIPCPTWIGYSESQLNSSCRYFPLVGSLIGVSGSFVWSITQYFWDPSIALLLSMLTTILITGGFHEDGLSDTCDGFGGGWNRSQILSIMKDSRVGAYGVIGITFALGLKFALLHSLPSRLVIISLIAAHTASRFLATSFIYTHEYARDDETSKIRPLAYRMQANDLIFGGLTTLIVLLLLKEDFIFLLLCLVIVRIVLSKFLLKTLNGYTGDILGAVQQVSELTVYLAVAKYT
jgi:adenosylcobinamide-GDP ribazoletransferase